MVSPRVSWLCSLFENHVVAVFQRQIVADGETSLSASDDDGFKFAFHVAPLVKIPFTRFEVQQREQLMSVLARFGRFLA